MEMRFSTAVLLMVLVGFQSKRSHEVIGGTRWRQGADAYFGLQFWQTFGDASVAVKGAGQAGLHHVVQPGDRLIAALRVQLA